MLGAERELTVADPVARAKAGGVAADPTALSELAVNVTPDGVSGPHALDALDRALVGLDREYDYVVVDRDGEFVIWICPELAVEDAAG